MELMQSLYFTWFVLTLAQIIIINILWEKTAGLQARLFHDTEVLHSFAQNPP